MLRSGNDKLIIPVVPDLVPVYAASSIKECYLYWALDKIANPSTLRVQIRLRTSNRTTHTRRELSEARVMTKKIRLRISNRNPRATGKRHPFSMTLLNSPMYASCILYKHILYPCTDVANKGTNCGNVERPLISNSSNISKNGIFTVPLLALLQLPYQFCAVARTLHSQPRLSSARTV